MSTQEPGHPDELPEDGSQLRAWAERERHRRLELETSLADTDQVKRENALLRAGVDIDSPLGAMFARGYDGELDRDTVRGAWEAIQPSRERNPEATAVSTEATEEELRAQTERANLAAGSMPPGQEPSPDPYVEGYEAFQQALKRGERRENAAAEVINRVVDAAVKGDPRVLFNEREWAEKQRQAGHSHG